MFFWIFLVFWVLFKAPKATTKIYQGWYWTPKIAKNGPKQHIFLPKRPKRPQPKAQALRRAVYSCWNKTYYCNMRWRLLNLRFERKKNKLWSWQTFLLTDLNTFLHLCPASVISSPAPVPCDVPPLFLLLHTTAAKHFQVAACCISSMLSMSADSLICIAHIRVYCGEQYSGAEYFVARMSEGYVGRM